MNLTESIILPFAVNIASALAIWLFVKTFKIIPKLIDKYSGIEYEYNEITGNTKVDVMMAYLINSCHSFDWLRNKKEFNNYSDDKFREIINSYPDHFKPIGIIRHDENGNVKLPSNPGVKLTKLSKEIIDNQLKRQKS